MENEKVKVLEGSKENTIKLENGKDEFRQHIIRTLHIDVSGIKYSEGYDSYNLRDKPDEYHFSERLSGQGKLNDDQLAIIGSDAPKISSLPVAFAPIEPSPDEPEWHAVIGWLASDWETGTDETWYCQIYVARDCFEKMLKARAHGGLKSVHVGLNTDAWAQTYDYYSPPSAKVTWYLRPDRNGSIRFPDSAKGHVTQLHWGEVTHWREADEQSDDTVLLDDHGDDQQLARSDPTSPNQLLLTSVTAFKKQLARIFWALMAIAVVLFIGLLN